jgi:hypothetical protein
VRLLTGVSPVCFPPVTSLKTRVLLPSCLIPVFYQVNPSESSSSAKLHSIGAAKAGFTGFCNTAVSLSQTHFSLSADRLSIIPPQKRSHTR